MVTMIGDDGYVAFLNNKFIYDGRDMFQKIFLLYIHNNKYEYMDGIVGCYRRNSVETFARNIMNTFLPVRCQ